VPGAHSPELLRPGLLEGVSLLVIGSAERGEPTLESLGRAVREACERLGSRVRAQAREPDGPDPSAGEAAIDAVVATAASESGGIDMLVVDCAAMFASGGLRGCLDGAWDATRAVVNLAFLPAEPARFTRRIIYLAPSPGEGERADAHAGEQADAARAGLENLARTLSVEWARHGITVVTIAPGEETTTGEVAALCAYLASPAGAYFSGCLLDLRGVER
jgi:NAD(P)-dependent dehydrogenase (short-subunit alcohol dehydrogenase family)